MQLHNLLKVFVRNLFTCFGKRVDDILGWDPSIVVIVKTFENCFYPLICQKILSVDGGSDELGVVDSTVSFKINLVYDVFHFFGRQFDVRFFKGYLELVNHYEPILPDINLLKFFS